MIRPVCVKPSINKSIAFAGYCSNETTTVTPDTKVEPKTDLEELKGILDLKVEDLWTAGIEQNGRKKNYLLSLKASLEKPISEVKTRGDLGIETKKLMPGYVPLEKSFSTWGTSIHDSNDAGVHEKVAEACTHVRKLYKQYCRQNNSKWERLLNLFRR